MSTSRTCMVKDCGNSDYRKSRWQQQLCQEHGCCYGHKAYCHCDQQPCQTPTCDCPPPFQLLSFPTEKADPEGRMRWIRCVNRQDPKRPPYLLHPSKSTRICSVHFVDGIPTATNPDPTLNMGFLPKINKLRRRLVRAIPPSSSSTAQHLEADEISNTESSLPSERSHTETNTFNNPFVQYIYSLFLIIFSLIFANTILKISNSYLYQQFVHQKKIIKSSQLENEQLKCTITALKSQDNSLFKQSVKSDEDLLFYTGIPNLRTFDALYNLLCKYVNRRWRGLKITSTRRRRLFHNSPKKFGPARKLCGQDEFFLTLVRLRLGLLNKDLAARFNISTTLCQQIFHAWLTAMDKILGKALYWSPKHIIQATKPARYRHLPDLRAIIDCTELFIETPKDLNLQANSWSDYKHHNTLKFLIAVAPNSAITYVSPCYLGRASDKALTNNCGFLDLCEEYDMLQADKGFNIQKECDARFITFHVPPGKRGAPQMSSKLVNKTKHIANLRILVEQVIRRLKTFHMLKQEVPISLVPHIDKIVRVCSALCNLRSPIYSS